MIEKTRTLDEAIAKGELLEYLEYLDGKPALTPEQFICSPEFAGVINAIFDGEPVEAAVALGEVLASRKDCDVHAPVPTIQ